MDCNREEALRAKGIAEKKMECSDFMGARKVALKAQHLYPDLENIAQMLVICDVHCSAAQKLLHNETDWYGILQVEQTANEATIKKQYRKLALQLHPDKNKFAGAESAFKLIGEAQRVLLDREKRTILDMKRRASVNRPAMSHQPPPNVYTNVNVGVQNNAKTNSTNLNPQQQQSQQGANGGRPTFWTVCPFCSVKYQYYREVVNRSLRCQNCNRPFVAYDVNLQAASTAANSSQLATGQQKDGLNRGSAKVDVRSQSNLNTENSNRVPSGKKGPNSNVASEKLNGKRKRKQRADLSESSHSIGSTSTDTGEDMADDGYSVPGGQNYSAYKEENPRRSSRQKQKVSYKENVSDDEDYIPSKMAEGSVPPSGAEVKQREASKMNDTNGKPAKMKNYQKENRHKPNLFSEESFLNRNEETDGLRGKETVGGSNMTAEDWEHSTPDSTSTATVSPDVYNYPDPEFSDFEKDKKDGCFAAGQIWAIYDTRDAMPRFYAQIKKVLSPGFKLRITWFEPDPDDADEMNWVLGELPAACGKFKFGETQTTEDHPMFSHLISYEKISRRDGFKVYPKKGETWALFKNWDIKWYLDVESHQNYEFEFVEILSDYVEGEGVSVVYLAKLKGFVSLFTRIMKEGSDSFRIPSVELFRFSHRIPSFRMTGQERVGVPVGSYELDPAALPMNLEEIAVPEDLEAKIGCTSSRDSSMRSSDRLKPMTASDKDAFGNVKRSNLVKENEGFEDDSDTSAHSELSPEEFETPDSQFYNFDAAKSMDEFQAGQIWALYSDEDGLPKYYGLIRKVVTGSDPELHVVWLASCWLPSKAIMWEEKEMLFTCGTFKIKRGSSSVYTDTKSFSHQVHTDTGRKNNQYDIFPRRGEVWALYRKWTAKMKLSDLQNCEYDVLEVLQDSDSWIEVLVLELVGGFNSVFKGKSNGRSAVTMRIPLTDLLRFSHQIPAFKLTDEQDGSLRGFWELDAAALPVYYFGSK